MHGLVTVEIRIAIPAQGSIADLETVLTLEPASRQAKVVEELASLRARAKALTLQGHRAAAQARQTSRTVAASCTIEEVADDPEEAHEVCVSRDVLILPNC
jgi:hypothetical protein